MTVIRDRFNQLDKELDELLSSNKIQFSNKVESNNIDESPAKLKKTLSFTERLEMCDRDVENGFKFDVPTFEANLSQNLSQLSQESDISDNEINYSRIGEKNQSVRVECNLQLSDDGFNEINDFNNSNPIDFNMPELYNPVLESEDVLMNKSVCNILEKTFDHGNSPICATKTKRIGAKTLKKINSESVLSSRYDLPSTSKAADNEFPYQPTDWGTPKKTVAAQSSQSSINTDLSNDDYIIRIGSVSPKPNFEQMGRTEIEVELRKFGLKPSMSRRHAIICLDYIYIRMHPFLENASLEKSVEKSPNTQQVVAQNQQQKNDLINFNVGFSSHNLADEKFKTVHVDQIFLPSRPRAKVFFN